LTKQKKGHGEMPKITTIRTDILRQKEAEAMLKTNCETWLKCLIALSLLFGKRISENLLLTRSDIWTDKKFLYVRFPKVLKKRDKTGIPKPYIKKITLRHPATRYVIEYVNMNKSDKLFEVSRQLALYYLKKVNPDAWFHLFRHSLATQIAEHGGTESELMGWFDWDDAKTAHG
jgi:integrase